VRDAADQRGVLGDEVVHHAPRLTITRSARRREISLQRSARLAE
jgi:hypothetical protein